MIDPSALAMVTTEPTAGAVWHANRGALTLRISVRGTSAHVGQAYLGVNAFEHMLAVAHPLVVLGKEMQQQRTSFPLEEDAARGSMLVVGGASGSGANFNVVPDAVWFSVDCRFDPEESLDDVLAQINETISEAANGMGADVSVEVLQRQPSASTDVNHPAAKTLARCVADVEGEPPRFLLCPGVLETRWYASWASRRSLMVAGDSTSRTVLTSTSTKKPCGVARRSTRTTRRSCSRAGGDAATPDEVRASGCDERIGIASKRPTELSLKSRGKTTPGLIRTIRPGVCYRDRLLKRVRSAFLCPTISMTHASQAW